MNTYIKHLLLISFLCSSIAPQPAHAMDGAQDGYSYIAMLASTAIAGGIGYLLSTCCRNSTSETDIPNNLKYVHFSDWKNACDNLPHENESYMHTALDLHELIHVVRAYTDLEMSDSSFRQQEKWLGRIPHDTPLFEGKFTPHVQKLIVTPQAEVAFHGDLHGDIHALNEFIQDLNLRGKMNGFNILQDNFYLIFLGDYTDRGYYGAEVWYTILRLKLANPERVIMVRGNHEDCEINARDGFLEELQTKFGTSNTSAYFELQRLYNFLPIALYLGSGTPEETNYLLCCHGGLELGFDPKPLLSDARNNVRTLVLDDHHMLDRTHGIARLSQSAQEAIHAKIPAPLLSSCRLDKPVVVQGAGRRTLVNQLGFMWNDHIIQPDKIVDFMNGRGWLFGKQLTHETLATHSNETHKLKGIFRAHQHGDLEMMERILNRDHKGHAQDAGVGKLWTDHAKIKEPQALWDGIVCTFLVAPARFGKIEDCPFDYDAFGILKFAPKFDDWRLEMIRIKEKLVSLSPDSPNSSSSDTAYNQYASVACTSSNAHLSDLFD